MGYIKSIPFCS